MDLSQPRILRTPRMIHGSWPLRNRMIRIICLCLLAQCCPFIRSIPCWQRREMGLYPILYMIGGFMRTFTLCCQLEFCQRLKPELKGHGLRGIKEPLLDRPVLISSIGMFIEFRLFRNFFHPETTIFNITVNLIRVRLTAPGLIALLAAEASQRTYARFTLMIDHIIRIISKFSTAIFIGHAWQAKTRAEIEQDRLKAAYIAIRLHHRPADTVCNGICLANRPVKKRDTVVPLKIGCVRQDQICKRHHF